MNNEKKVRLQWIALAFLCFLAIILLALIFLAFTSTKANTKKATNYAECLTANDAKISNSIPKQCTSGGNTFADPTPQAATNSTGLSRDDASELKKAYTQKNGVCSEPTGGSFTVKKMTANGWAEVSVGCEPGSGHLEVWRQVSGTWTYLVGFQEGPFCSMVIDKQISKELYATCITTASGPTSSTDANGNPIIPNQIP